MSGCIDCSGIRSSRESGTNAKRRETRDFLTSRNTSTRTSLSKHVSINNFDDSVRARKPSAQTARSLDESDESSRQRVMQATWHSARIGDYPSHIPFYFCSTCWIRVGVLLLGIYSQQRRDGDQEGPSRPDRKQMSETHPTMCWAVELSESRASPLCISRFDRGFSSRCK